MTIAIHIVRTLILLAGLLALGQPVLAVESVTYLHNDAAGSPVAATDAAGNVIWRESYRAYGERTRNEAASRTNRQFFHGKAFDADSGLAYFGARYYDPVVGRFMAMDPQGFDEANLHSFNRYAYGNNNPYKYTDRDGRFAILIPIVGLVVGGGLAVVANHPARPYGSSGSIENSVPGFGAGSPTRRWNRLFSEEAKGDDKPVRDVYVPADKYPETAGHIGDAQNNGQPDVLTIDRKGAKGRRAEAMGGQPIVPGRDRDEYPPAVFGEGGKGASVRPISPSDNRGAGACIGAQCRDLPDGSRVRIIPK